MFIMFFPAITFELSCFKISLITFFCCAKIYSFVKISYIPEMRHLPFCNNQLSDAGSSLCFNALSSYV